MDLSIGQERFEQTINAINLRKEFIVKELQPVISSSGINRKLLSPDEVKATLGEYLFEGAHNYTSTMYEMVNHSFTSLHEIFVGLRKLATKLFPEENFFRIKQED